MLTEFKTRPLPCIFCLVAHKSKIVCQAEMSGSWQDAPVTFQLERASVLQPSGQISNNRSSRKELSSNHKEVSGNLLDKLLGALWLDKVMFCWVSLGRLFFIAFRRSILVFEFQDDVFLQKPFGPCPRIWKVYCWRERGRKEREHGASYLDSMSCLSYTSMIGPEASVAGVRPVGIRLAGRALVSMSQTFKKLFLAVPV